MAGQIPTRRQVLEAMVLASMASFAPGFVRWSPAQQTNEHQHQAGLVSPQVHSPYKPVAFDLQQYAAVERLCDLIIPTDGTSPGATAAGVSEFIDFMVSHDPSVQQPFFQGLKALDAVSCKSVGAEFHKLTAEQAGTVLTRIAYKQHFRPGDEAAQQFFRLVRKYTVMGFYTSRVGFEALDSPNLRFYAESPGCPDPQDVTHHHSRGVPAA